MADRTVLSGGLVVSGPAWVPGHADLLVDGTTIEAVGAPGDFDHVDATRVDLRDRLIVPGLVNAHLHSHNMVARGAARDWTLEASLLHGGWMSATRRLELVELCALLAGAETMASGATGAFDLMAWDGVPEPDALLAAADAYTRVGLRVRLAPMVADRTIHEAVPAVGGCCTPSGATPATVAPTVAPTAAPTAAILAACERFVRDLEPLADMTAGLAPTIPSHCSTELMVGLRRLADRHGLPLHLHLAESKPQAISAADRYGHSITVELDRIGLLDGPLTAAHAIWIDDADIELLARSSAVVVTVPGSNLRLGSGLAPTRALVDAGVVLAVGSDGANSADALDVLDAARLANLVSRTSTTGPRGWLTVEQTLDAATEGGAAACGWSDSARIEAGRRADLTVLDLRAAAFCPPNDVANQLLTAARSGDVTDVMSAGRFRLRDGAVVGVDVGRARARFAELAEELLAGVGERRDLAGEQVQAAAGALDDLRQRPWPVTRLLP